MLAEKEYVDVFLSYVDSNNKYAVLLDGEWGSGKTFFVKTYLIPALKNAEKRVVYISLYGTTSKQEIERDICLKSIPFLNTKEGPFKGKREGLKLLEAGAKTGGSLVTAFLKTLNFDMGTIKIDYLNLVDTKNLVVIFDDLERCLLEVNETLGYINSFVEQDEIKIILIANEKEIYKINSSRNYEMKLLVSAQKNIEVDLQKKANLLSQPKEETNHKPIENFSIDTLLKRSDEIFSKRLMYSQIKEKLIGRTIYYRPNYQALLQELLGRSLPDENSDVISALIKYFCDEMSYYDHYNLRTVFFSIDTLLTLKTKLSISTLIDVIRVELYKYCIDTSVRFKVGRPAFVWLDKAEVGEVNVGKSDSLWEFNFIKGFKFIDDLVYTSFFDEERARNTLHKYVNEYSMLTLSASDPFTQLKYWYNLEDSDIYKNIDDMILRLKEDKYSINHYPQIIQISLILDRIGFSINLDEIVESMKMTLRKKEGLKNGIIFDTFGVTIEESIANKYQAIIEQIKESIGKSQKSTTQEKLAEIINSGNDWAERFLEYAYEKKNDFMRDQAFLSLVNNNDLFTAIINSKNGDIMQFRYSLQTIYNLSNIGSFFKSDCDSVTVLWQRLKEYFDGQTGIGIVKRYNIKYLLDHLENIQAALK